MCGIIGYTGTENAVPKLLEGLSALEYRGYDSAGIALSGNNELTIIKAAGRLSSLKKKVEERSNLYAVCGIGHTRWATHGEPNDVNSHPHGTARIHIVHNGIIENYVELKAFLKEQSYEFDSETDTEVAAKLIDYFYCKTNDPIKAICSARDLLKGSYAIGVLFYDKPNIIYSARKDNPLIAAFSDDGCYIASDIPAVLKYTNKYYHIEEDEICIITEKKIEFIGDDGVERHKEIQVAEWDMEAAEKGGYSHFMIKEIHEEPEAVVKTLRPRLNNGVIDFGIEELTDEKLKSFEKIHIVACGTAMHAGLIGKYAIEKLARIPVTVDIASEFRYRNPILNKKDLVIIISQSGETADTLAALRLAKNEGVYTLALVNVAGSTIAREADGVIYTWAGPEIAVASTKAYTVQISLLYLIALRFARATEKLTDEEIKAYSDELLIKAPEAISKALEFEGVCARVAKKYKDSTSIFFMGRGADYYMCLEAALKLKEISYIHCEAYAAGELKHGTISLIVDKTPIFAMVTNNDIFDKFISNIKEVKARGAEVLLICGENAKIPDGIADDIIRVPEMNELFMPIPSATVTQLIAYYTSLYLGYDVDKPRNLAKSVTVE